MVRLFENRGAAHRLFYQPSTGGQTLQKRDKPGAVQLFSNKRGPFFGCLLVKR